MPSYSTPSTNLSTGLSTKPTRLIPGYLAKTQNYVPLSVFFAGVPEQEADPDSLFGLRMPGRKKKEPAKSKEKKSKGGSTDGEKEKQGDDDEKKDAPDGAEGPQKSQTSKPRPQSSVPAQAPQQGAQAAPATGKQESLSGVLGRLLDVVQGKSVAPFDEPTVKRLPKTEITTTANVPTLPIPIGAGDGRKFLDYPDDDKRKRKKKRRRLSRSLYVLLRQ